MNKNTNNTQSGPCRVLNVYPNKKDIIYNSESTNKQTKNIKTHKKKTTTKA